MTDKIGIFYFSSIPYNFLKQRPQQLYEEWKTLLDDKFEFFYIEPNGFDSYLKKMLFRKFKNSNIFPVPLNEKNQIFYILSKLLFNKSLNKYKKIDKKIAIVCTPSWENYISNSSFDIICYDYLDSIKVHSTNRNYNKIRVKHEKLILKSDIIFTTAKKLKEDIFSISTDKKVITVTNGVDPNFFEKNANFYKISDYKKTNRTVVGYVGALYNWIDLDLILECAKSLLEVDFVLIGPISDENKKYLINKPKNVFVLGKKEYNQIPAYIKMFDIAIIPFKKGEISETTDPIKVYEYFSLGKPVISTYMKQLTPFNGNLLKMINTKEEFIDAINFFLEKDNKHWKNKRKAIAYKNTWSDKSNSILNSIMEYYNKKI